MIDYKKPSYTVDCIIFEGESEAENCNANQNDYKSANKNSINGIQDSKSANKNCVNGLQDSKSANVLLIRRKNEPCKGALALPGGFVDEGESAEEAAARELSEETCISGINLKQLYTVSTPNRDVRGWTVSTVFIGESAQKLLPSAGDDASAASVYNISYKNSGNIYTLYIRENDESARANSNGTIANNKKVAQCRVKAVKDFFGKLDVNKTMVLDGDVVAFDHAKLILLSML